MSIVSGRGGVELVCSVFKDTALIVIIKYKNRCNRNYLSLSILLRFTCRNLLKSFVRYGHCLSVQSIRHIPCIITDND